MTENKLLKNTNMLSLKMIKFTRLKSNANSFRAVSFDILDCWTVSSAPGWRPSPTGTFIHPYNTSRAAQHRAAGLTASRPGPRHRHDTRGAEHTSTLTANALGCPTSSPAPRPTQPTPTRPADRPRQAGGQARPPSHGHGDLEIPAAAGTMTSAAGQRKGELRQRTKAGKIMCCASTAK